MITQRCLQHVLHSKKSNVLEAPKSFKISCIYQRPTPEPYDFWDLAKTAYCAGLFVDKRGCLRKGFCREHVGLSRDPRRNLHGKQMASFQGSSMQRSPKQNGKAAEFLLRLG